MAEPGAVRAIPDRVAGELGLRPKPAPDPAILAALAVAADTLWPRPVGRVEERDQPRLAWRFSGRWWHKPLVLRRDRPWPER